MNKVGNQNFDSQASYSAALQEVKKIETAVKEFESGNKKIDFYPYSKRFADLSEHLKRKDQSGSVPPPLRIAHQSLTGRLKKLEVRVADVSLRGGMPGPSGTASPNLATRSFLYGLGAALLSMSALLYGLSGDTEPSTPDAPSENPLPSMSDASSPRSQDTFLPRVTPRFTARSLFQKIQRWSSQGKPSSFAFIPKPEFPEPANISQNRLGNGELMENRIPLIPEKTDKFNLQDVDGNQQKFPIATEPRDEPPARSAHVFASDNLYPMLFSGIATAPFLGRMYMLCRNIGTKDQESGVGNRIFNNAFASAVLTYGIVKTHQSWERAKPWVVHFIPKLILSAAASAAWISKSPAPAIIKIPGFALGTSLAYFTTWIVQSLAVNILDRKTLPCLFLYDYESLLIGQPLSNACTELLNKDPKYIKDFYNSELRRLHKENAEIAARREAFIAQSPPAKYIMSLLVGAFLVAYTYAFYRSESK